MHVTVFWNVYGQVHTKKVTTGRTFVWYKFIIKLLGKEFYRSDFT